MNARIAAVTLDQLPAVLPLWRESMAHHAGLVPFFQPAPDGETAWERHVAVALAKGEGLLLAAWVTDEPAGLIFGQLQSHAPIFRPGKLGYISDLYVRPDYRRHGLGRLLFLALRDWLADQGATALDLQVYTANGEATAFWRAMGFTSYAERMRMETPTPVPSGTPDRSCTAWPPRSGRPGSSLR